MNLQFISYPKYKKKIKKLYLRAFPKKERFPFWVLKHSLSHEKAFLSAKRN